MNKLDFQCYTAGSDLSHAFVQDKIPLLLMEHLRQLDFMISCGSSYELTAYTFLIQLMTNESLRPLRDRESLVVLLNEEGALVRNGELWHLYFRPEQEEKRTLALDAPLFPVYARLMQDHEDGAVCRIDIPLEMILFSVLNRKKFSILDEYCRQYPGGYMAVARKIVLEGTAELYAHVPFCRYAALSSVDPEEIESYRSIKALLDDYIYEFDHRDSGESLQPLSIAVFGAPGSGKSFGVKQLAKSCGRFQIATLNLSQFDTVEDLFAALSEALHVDERAIPLIFFDEFDSALRGVSRGWLKLLLAPMQDGEYTLKGRTHRIDRAVFVFAGGTASTFQGFLPQDEEQAAVFKSIKGPDFISRLKGTLNIKGPNPSSLTDHTYIIRRALLLRDLIIRKFPGIYHAETGTVAISESLLSVLLNVSEYRHGTRSIEFLLGMSRLSGIGYFTSSCLPMPEQLDLHLDVDDFSRKLMFEQVAGGLTEQYARLSFEACDRRSTKPQARMWEELPEPVKENYRSQYRHLIRHIMDGTCKLKIRPIQQDQSGVVHELYGSVLEQMAGLEHERICLELTADGWRKGNSYNVRFRTSPYLVPYEELPEDRKDSLRIMIRDVPGILQQIGFELIRAEG